MVMRKAGLGSLKAAVCAVLATGCPGGGGGGGSDAGGLKAGDPCTENTGHCDGDHAALKCQAGTLVTVLCNGPAGCSSSSALFVCDQSGNAVGDVCVGENTGHCDGVHSEMVCQSSRLVAIPCKGSGGCSEVNHLIMCDQSGNTSGDACSVDDNGLVICSGDGTKRLTCGSGNWSLTDCPGGCTGSGSTINCIPVNPLSTWDVVATSATFQTTEPNGSAWDYAGGAPDPKLCWYDDYPAPTGKVCTPAVSDAFQPNWTYTIASGIRASALMDQASHSAICLYDEDVTSDDNAGCVYARYTVDQLQTGQVTVTLTPNADGTFIGNAVFTVRLVQH